jgi:hypothetical protein
VLEIDERATSERRVGLEPPIQAREHFPDHRFNTITTTTRRRQYNHDTLYSRTLFTKTSNPRTALLTGLCRKSKAGEVQARESEQPTLIYETRHNHALSGPTLDITRDSRDSHDLRSLYMTLRCIYHANSSASCTSTCNETHTHFLRLSLS